MCTMGSHQARVTFQKQAAAPTHYGIHKENEKLISARRASNPSHADMVGEELLLTYCAYVCSHPGMQKGEEGLLITGQA